MLRHIRLFSILRIRSSLFLPQDFCSCCSLGLKHFSSRSWRGLFGLLIPSGELSLPPCLQSPPHHHYPIPLLSSWKWYHLNSSCSCFRWLLRHRRPGDLSDSFPVFPAALTVEGTNSETLWLQEGVRWYARGTQGWSRRTGLSSHPFPHLGYLSSAPFFRYLFPVLNFVSPRWFQSYPIVSSQQLMCLFSVWLAFVSLNSNFKDTEYMIYRIPKDMNY